MKKKTAPIVSMQNIIKLDPDTISQKLIESVGMVKDLLKSNKDLLSTINTLTDEKQSAEGENVVL